MLMMMILDTDRKTIEFDQTRKTYFNPYKHKSQNSYDLKTFIQTFKAFLE